MTNETIEAIEEAFKSGRKIAVKEIALWMKFPNLSVKGCLYAFILKEQFLKNLDVPLNNKDIFEFVIQYLFECIKEDPQGEWVHSRYEAGWDLVNWFAKWWNDKQMPREYIRKFKELLAQVYKQGDKDIKECIENATLEHLFENNKVVHYFKDWQNDADLSEAFKNATLWLKHDGSSPKGFGFGKES